MSQRRSLQLLRGPSRWKMTKLETWKDSSEAVKTRPVGSIPWGLYLETSLVVHSAYLIMKSKDLIRTLAPCPRRHSTTSGLPASTAKCRAVYLWLVIVLTFSPLAIIALMTPTWPFWAATWIPLAPCLSKRNNNHILGQSLYLIQKTYLLGISNGTPRLCRTIAVSEWPAK